MKILMVHNFYGSGTPSGENEIFKNENTLLTSRGHQLSTFLRHSDEIRNLGVRGLLRGALSTPWNPWMARAISQAISEDRPDVVHVHNTFPLLSPSIFGAIGSLVPCVVTLHNYRLFCSAGMLIRPDGTLCTRCLDERSVRPSLQYGCYRKSRTATFPLAISIALHRRLDTWTGHVDAFLAGTEFQRTLMIKSGLPPGRVFVKPNFFPGNPSPTDWQNRDETVVFAGRLSMEKGVDALVSAWVNWGAGAPQLRILGDGPLRPELEKRAAGFNIVFMGQQSAMATQVEMGRAKLLILPSQSFECFPMVICEAFAHGTPVAVSATGPLSTIVNDGVNGVIFTAGSPTSIEKTVRCLWSEPERLRSLASGARRSFDAHYTPQKNYDLLMTIYEQARAIHQQRGNP